MFDDSFLNDIQFNQFNTSPFVLLWAHSDRPVAGLDKCGAGLPKSGAVHEGDLGDDAICFHEPMQYLDEDSPYSKFTTIPISSLAIA